MGDDFLRIFDDDELAENAATEVFTRIPGRALFDDDEDEEKEPVFVSREKSGASPSLPGKVVAEKKP
ncbi:MAG: hypothetical protein HN348_01215 [Proteobacteria bacterium]|nr:hypothetical protein [Pseudomonadota bacterium]